MRDHLSRAAAATGDDANIRAPARRARDPRSDPAAGLQVERGRVHVASEVVGRGLWAGEGAAISHEAAARLHGLDGFESEVVSITVSRRGMKVPAPWIVLRTAPIEPADATTVAGLRVTTVHKTLIDLGAAASDPAVEAALESALRRGLTSIPYLRKRLAANAGRGRRGCATLRRLLERYEPERRPTETSRKQKWRASRGASGSRG